MAMDSTAIGMEAETVRPTLTARYTDEAAKTMPSTEPSTSPRTVSSGRDSAAGTYGSWVRAEVRLGDGDAVLGDRRLAVGHGGFSSLRAGTRPL